MKGMIFDIQEFTIHDGPGSRITIFMKGCPLRCAWCHNPEGQTIDSELLYKKNQCIHCNACGSFKNETLCPTSALTRCGYEIDSNELVQSILKVKDSLELLEGGVTFSGGEPSFQYEFLMDCFVKLKEKGIHTAIETSGYCEPQMFKEMMNICDYIIMDIKLMDDELHKLYTGVSNKIILENAKTLMQSNKDYCFRTPLIKDITDTKDNLNKIQEFIQNSNWEKLPENPYASLKYEQLNREYCLKRNV